MTAFRDQLAADVGDVFLNLAEFGESITIDGALVTAVVEGDATDGVGAVGGRAGGDSFEAAFVRRLTLHVASDDVTRPEDGQAVTLDLADGAGALAWYVRGVDEAEGVLALQLERQET